MIGEQLAYALKELAYQASIGAGLALVVIGVMALIMGIRIMLEDEPDYLCTVPLPRGVDNDDEL